MALTLHELKQYHDKAYNSGQVNRERASEDLVFYYVTHWDDNLLADSQLAYRGEFDMIKSAGKQILADLASNPVQNDFEAINGTPEEVSELADGLYRRDANKNSSIEAFSIGEQESVVCGCGAWVLYTEWLSSKTGDKKQIIRRRPYYEANNNGFWDPNAQLMDKSDADYHSYLRAYSDDGYKKLVKELTGEELESVSNESFKHPEHSYTFPWIGGEGNKIYVTEFYHREKVKEKIVTLEDPFGETKVISERVLEPVMDELMEQGFEIIDEKTIDIWEVRKYIASGAEILNGKTNSETDEREGDRIPGGNIPVVPEYGERAIVEGEEVYEGVTRLAKDPQRLRDFSMSYLSDILSRSPRGKDIYLQEQIAGFTHMYEQNGADNNFPYLLQNSKDAIGEPLPHGPVGRQESAGIPPALGAIIELSSSAIREVANPGLPQDIADPDTSGKAVLAMQARLDQQSMHYQENKKYSLRRDGEIYIGMASEIYDTSRTEKVESPDGTKSDVEIMEYTMDEETGDLVVLNDLRTAEFEVTSRITASYTSQKEQTLDRLEKVLASMAPDDPARKAVQLTILQLTDGVGIDSLKEYINKQLIMSGIKEPDTDEEKALLQQAQENQEPDAATLLAEAENKKGDADMLNAQREGVQMNLDDENTKMKNSIEMYKAETDRMNLQVDAQESGAKITKTGAETMGVSLDNQAKIKEIQTRSVEDMTTEDLFSKIMRA